MEKEGPPSCTFDQDKLILRYESTIPADVNLISVTENLPECPNCGSPAPFVHAADIGKDGRVYFIFRCENCDAGEFKIWRPQWQAMADMLLQFQVLKKPADVPNVFSDAALKKIYKDGKLVE